MSLFYEDLEKQDSFGKLGVLVIKDLTDLDLLTKKSSHFRDLDVEILIVSRLLPNDLIYSNCNFLIYDSLAKRTANEIIYEFVTDKKFTKILLYNKFVEEINIIGLNFDQFLYEQEKVSKTQEKFTVNFLSGAYLSISFPFHRTYYAQFWNKKTGNLLYSCDMWNGGWAMTVIKYFIDYNIMVFDKLTDELLWDYHIDFSNKNIFVNFESSALGDTIAWMNSIDDFIEKHECNLILSTFHNNLFEQEYPHIKFVDPGQAVHGIFAQFSIGWFYKEDSSINTNYHPRDFRTIPLHQTTSDILGVDFIQKRPKIKIPELPKPIEGDYVVISPYSTTQAKFWNNPDGWEELVDFFVKIGWKVIVISKEENGFMGNYFPNGVINKTGDFPLESRINDIRWSRMFIGLGSGLTWLAWATGVPQTIISGFSQPWTEPTGDNILRIHNPSVCNSCFNRERLDSGDWMWCPDKKNTSEQFICSKSISSDDVISKISGYFQFSTKEKTKSLDLVKAIMNENCVKKITLFTSNISVKNSMLDDFENLFEKGVDCVFTDKSPVIGYNLFKNLVRKDGLLVFYNPEDFTYIDSLSCKKLIYKGDGSDQNFVILFL
jgi:autotransporter strand-loop-strand O-heptosyltransferase